MRLLGIQYIDAFVKKHPLTESALRRWQKIITETDYKSMNELRKTFPTADYVKGKTVFNVGGNRVRAICVIEYGIRLVVVTHVLTHAEYDRNEWKET